MYSAADRFSARRGASRNRKFISAKKMSSATRLVTTIKRTETNVASVACLLSSNHSLAIESGDKRMYDVEYFSLYGIKQ